LCKQAEKGVSLQAEQYDWLADTDEEIDKQELEAHYSYMAKIQETEFEKYKAFNDRTVDYDKPERKLCWELNVRSIPTSSAVFPLPVMCSHC
nr:hypothetical protein [Tanacetum cinerariifolium]